MSDFEQYFNEFVDSGETSDQEGPDAAALPEQAPAQQDAGQDADHTSAQEAHGQQGAEQSGQDAAPQKDGQGGQGEGSPEGEAQAPAQAAREGDAEEEELRKKAATHDSMLGRLKREENELEDLRRKAASSEDVMQRLRQVREERGRMEQALQPGPGQTRPPERQPQQDQPLPVADIPEEIKEEAESFSREYPDLVPLLRFPGREGERLRKMIADYGPDMAAVYGQSVMTQYRLAQSEGQVQARVAQAEEMAKKAREEAMNEIQFERRAKHFSTIGERHPEALWAFDQARREDYAAFRNGLNEWIMDRPYREAQQIHRVLNEGTAPEVIAILDTFKAAGPQQPDVPRQDNGNAAKAQEERNRLAQAAAAVPGKHGQVRPAGGQPPPPDDFSAAWSEANRHS